MAKLYLTSCLSNQTFTMVALLDEKPAGIIIAKSIKDYKKSVKYLIPQLVAGMRLVISNEGRKIANTFDRYCAPRGSEKMKYLFSGNCEILRLNFNVPSKLIFHFFFFYVFAYNTAFIVNVFCYKFFSYDI